MRIKMPEQIAEAIEELYVNEGLLSQPIKKNDDYYELSVGVKDIDVLLDFVTTYNTDNNRYYQVMFMCDGWNENVVISETGIEWGRVKC